MLDSIVQNIFPQRKIYFSNTCKKLLDLSILQKETSLWVLVFFTILNKNIIFLQDI